MNKLSIVQAAAEKAIAAEAERTALLLRKGEKFAIITIIVIGFQLLNVKNLLGSPSVLARVACCLSLGSLILALFFAIYAVRVMVCADFPRNNKLWDNLKSEHVSEGAAQEAIVQLFLKIREQSAVLNDARAGSLFWCGWLLFTGCLLVVGSQLLDATTYNSVPL